MVGSAIAADLCQEYQVTAVDVDANLLDSLKNQYPVKTIKANASNQQAVKKLVANVDLAIGALPGSLGFDFLKTVIQSGKNIVDISFFNEDPFALDALARDKQVTAVVDCGVAPGMSNVILGYHAKQMQVEDFECLVGGLPFKRSWPFQYKAPFSPMDVIEVYLRPARLVENGHLVTKPALSDIECVDIDPVGTLESFNTDGLRTLVKTMNVPNMKEKTLRYPGHIEYIRVLRECGFFGKEPLKIDGGSVRPIDVTARLLIPTW